MPDLRDRSLLVRFGLATGVLALLFAIVRADPTQGLAFSAAFAFWLVHIGVGLACAVLAATALNRIRPLRRWPVALRLLVAGLVGSVLFAPLALVLEAWVPQASDFEAGDGVLDRWEAAGGILAVVAEWGHVAPSYMLAWMLLNLMPLAGGARPAAIAQEPSTTNSPATATSSENFLATLPPLIGRDVVHVAADLHYLQIETRAGRATILGNLASVARELADRGTQVHRSHWVAHAHVRRIARSRNGWYCELITGRKVPISRRRVAEVRARLGADFVVTSDA